MCGAAQSCHSVRGNHEHLSSHPLLKIVASQEGDWLNCCFSLQKRPKAQREWDDKHNPVQKVASEPNYLQGVQAQHILFKEGPPQNP